MSINARCVDSLQTHPQLDVYSTSWEVRNVALLPLRLCSRAQNSHSLGKCSKH